MFISFENGLIDLNVAPKTSPKSYSIIEDLIEISINKIITIKTGTIIAGIILFLFLNITHSKYVLIKRIEIGSQKAKKPAKIPANIPIIIGLYILSKVLVINNANKYATIIKLAA